MDKLSVRLEVAAKIHEDIAGQSALTATIREAAKLARRVEEAPVAEVTAGYDGPCAAFGCSDTADKAMSAMISQRVRLVRED